MGMFPEGAQVIPNPYNKTAKEVRLPLRKKKTPDNDNKDK